MVLKNNHFYNNKRHDIHCQVKGPILKDLYQNFKERWEIVETKIELPKLKEHNLSIINGSNSDKLFSSQIFRTITPKNAKGFQHIFSK
jgi:phosphatidylserine/phosphatidylglycerophosphate/cardiolipin synthase-like enzyme